MQIQMVLRVAGARLPSPPLLLLCSYSWTLNVVFYYLDDLETQKTISSRKKKKKVQFISRCATDFSVLYTHGFELSLNSSLSNNKQI